MNQKELDEILALHDKWLNDDPDGVFADLSKQDLQGLDLSFLNLADIVLSYANLSNATMAGTNLSGADLTYANLTDVNLHNANLADANLKHAKIIRADLSLASLEDAFVEHADLTCANLKGAFLRYTNMTYSDLTKADLTNADLENTCFDYANLKDANFYGALLDNTYLRAAKNVPHIPMVCPETGSFTAFKKVYAGEDEKAYICKLVIPASAKRSSATSRKCRADKAKVVAIYDLYGKKTKITEAHSGYCPDFLYKVGTTVYPFKPYCENRWKECESGIHFFMSFQEAVDFTWW